VESTKSKEEVKELKGSFFLAQNKKGH